MSDFGDIPNVAIDTALDQVPDRHTAATIRRWLVDAFRKAHNKEAEANKRCERLQSELMEVQKKEAVLQAKEQDLESKVITLREEHVKVSQVAQQLPQDLSNRLAETANDIKTTLSASSKEAIGPLYTRVENTETGVRSLMQKQATFDANVQATSSSIAGLPSMEDLTNWSRDQEAQRIDAIKSLISETMGAHLESFRAEASHKDSEKLEALQAKYDSCVKGIEYYKSQSNSLQREKERLGGVRNVLEEQVKGLSSEKEALEQEVQRLRGLPEELQEARRLLSDAEKDIEHQNKVIDERDRKIEEWEVYAEGLQSKIIDSKAAALERERIIRERDECYETTQSVRQDLIEAQFYRDEACNQLQKTEQARDKVTQAKSQLEQRLIDLEEKHLRMDEIHAKEIGDLNARLEEAHGRQRETDQLVEQLKRSLAVANADLRAEQAGSSESRTKVATLEQELRDEKSRSYIAEAIQKEVSDIRSFVEDNQRLRDDLASFLNQPGTDGHLQGSVPEDGFTSELSKMYARLSETFKGIPTAPGRRDTFDMQRVAIKIAPLLQCEGAKENLLALHSAQ
ncbi:hypothetical protein F53441_1671, partial [Fusarium austroafricanum]